MLVRALCNVQNARAIRCPLDVVGERCAAIIMLVIELWQGGSTGERQLRQSPEIDDAADSIDGAAVHSVNAELLLTCRGMQPSHCQPTAPLSAHSVLTLVLVPARLTDEQR